MSTITNKPQSIFFKTVKTSASKLEQTQKIFEEIAEFEDAIVLNTNWKEEATDVIQSLITLLENHTDEGFERLWNEHLIKMGKRNWEPRT